MSPRLWTGMVVGLVGLIPCAFCPSLESQLAETFILGFRVEGLGLGFRV